MLSLAKTILSWSGDDVEQDSILHRHHHNVCCRIAAAQSALSLQGDRRSEEIKTMLETLGPTLITKLTMSPFVYCAATRIISGDHEHADSLLGIMRDELAIARRTARCGEAWSSLADRCLVQDQGELVETRQPIIGEQIVVDFNSPWVRAEEPSSGVQNGRFLCYPQAERSLAVERLTSAFQLLEGGVPLAGRLVRNFTRVIKVRYRRDAHCGSEQVPRELGAIRISNPHSPAVDLLDLADFLLHETTHNFLTCIENVTGTFADGTSFLYRPVSPWSGRPIPLLSFCHAVYVYYSVFHFCVGLLALDAFSRFHSAAREKARRCASGFLFHTPMSEYLSYQTSVREDLSAELDVLQDEIRTVYTSELA